MHSCKTTRNSLIDLALEDDFAKSALLLEDLATCGDCRAEYASLQRALSVVNQATRAALPGEHFWPGYHARLTERLRHAATADSAALTREPKSIGRLWSALKNIAGASVRIPVPVAAALLLTFGLSAFFLARGQATQELLPPAPVEVTKIIEVPVIKETVVTRVVYVPRNRRPSPAQPDLNGSGTLSGATANLSKNPANKTELNLSGFRPTDQVKLTIIKGSYHDEK